MGCKGCSGKLGNEGKDGLCLACQEELDRLVYLATQEELRIESEAIATDEQIRKAG